MGPTHDSYTQCPENRRKVREVALDRTNSQRTVAMKRLVAERMSNPQLRDNLGRVRTVISEEFYPNGEVKRRVFTDGGVPHNSNGPAVIHYDDEGRVEEEFFFEQGALRNSTGGPTMVTYQDGRLESKFWVSSYTNPTGVRIDYTVSGSAGRTTHLRDGVPHRENGEPAVIDYHSGTTVVAGYQWRENGKPVRADDQPTSVGFYLDGSVQQESWENATRDGSTPERRTFHPDGKLATEQWPDGVEDRPKLARYYPSGVMESELWTNAKGSKHRDDGFPAEVTYHEHGGVAMQKFYRNGKLHRDEGPVEQEFAEDGSLVSEKYAQERRKQVVSS